MERIAAALVKAQRAFGPALKSSSNPHFKSKYADLAACVEAVIDGLNANGIALIQKQHPSEGGVAVETVFVHESGETLSAGTLTVPASKQDPQGYGSALTYARRYSLMAACGIAPEDDDGNAASKTAIKKGPGVISAPSEAFKSLPPDWQMWVTDFAKDVANAFEQQGAQAARALLDEVTEREQLQPEHIAATWALLPSKARSGIKAAKEPAAA